MSKQLPWIARWVRRRYFTEGERLRRMRAIAPATDPHGVSWRVTRLRTLPWATRLARRFASEDRERTRA